MKRLTFALAVALALAACDGGQTTIYRPGRVDTVTVDSTVTDTIWCVHWRHGHESGWHCLTKGDLRFALRDSLPRDFGGPSLAVDTSDPNIVRMFLAWWNSLPDSVKLEVYHEIKQHEAACNCPWIYGGDNDIIPIYSPDGGVSALTGLR